MQRIRTYDLFGLLCDLSVFVGRQKFGTYRGVENVRKHLAAFIENIVPHYRVDHPSHERFRHTAVDTVHTHMIGIISAPTERKLAQISRADYKSADLARIIHKHLGAFARLRIFKCQIELFGILTYVRKMLFDRRFYRDLEIGYPEAFHKLKRVIVSAVGRSEAGHRYSDHICQTPAATSRGFGADKQRKRGIKTARYAYHRLRTGDLHALLKPHYLHFKYIHTARGTIALGVRHERQLPDFIILKIAVRNVVRGKLREHYRPFPDHTRTKRRALSKGLELQAVNAQLSEINIPEKNIVIINGFGVFGKNTSVLADHTVTREDQVGSGLARACRNIDVCAEFGRRAGADKRASVAALRYSLITCRKVDYHLCTGKRKQASGGHGCPQIFTDLRAEAEISGVKYYPAAERHVLILILGNAEFCRRKLRKRGLGSGRKPSALVKFIVGRDIRLRHYTAQFAV